MNGSNKLFGNRRDFLRGTVATLGAGLSGSLIGTGNSRAAKKSAGQIVIKQSGGAYQDANKKAFFDPFTEETGIEVVISNAGSAEIAASVEKGQVQVDILDTGETTCFEFDAKGALAQLDYDAMKLFNVSDIHEHVVRPTMIGKTYWANVMAYRTDAFPSGTHPKSWTEFWDAERFPGARALQDNTADLAEVEFALIADGVPAQADKLYPADIERAFKSYSRIRPHVIKFWDSGALPQSLLERKEVVLASIWNGRAQTLVDAGAPVAIEWNQARRQIQFWCVMKDAPNRDLAMKFIDFAMQPKPQADCTRYIAYGPTNKIANSMIRPEDAVKLASSNENYPRGFDLDARWWMDNQAKVDETWREWALG